LQRICVLPCRCHAGFFILHGTFTDAGFLPGNIELVARPERFELLTPRFVVCRLGPITSCEVVEALELSLNLGDDRGQAAAA